MRRWLVLALALWSLAATAQPLDPGTIAKLLRHGPWPQAAIADPSNRVSGRPEAVAFGRALFVDARLSADGRVACVTCHKPEHGFGDGLKLGRGLAEATRNTQGLFDVRLNRWFGWDGGNDTLWGQSIRPILLPAEMGLTVAQAAAILRREPDLACGYRRAFARSPESVADEALLVDLGKALAAFQETLGGGRSPFDDFRDALAAGDRIAAARYPAAAARGAALFVGRAQCAVCHLGPAFTNREFHDIGVPFFTAGDQVDPGRHQGLRRLAENRYGLLGPYNDDPARATGLLSRQVAARHRNWGEFRVPSLRNVALTAPYMHNGSVASLRDAVRHYSELDESRLHADGDRLLRALHLSEAEIDDLVAFLDSLTGAEARAVKLAPPEPCR